MSNKAVWPVYAGKSFNLWNPDTGKYYDSVDAALIKKHLHSKRLSQHGSHASAFSEQLPEDIQNPDSLPCLHQRIVYREVTNHTNTRTFVVAVIPGGRALIHKAPYLLRTKGTPSDEMYLLGVLSSMVCDWQARRSIELTVTFAHLNDFSIPDPGEGHPVRDRVAEIATRLSDMDNDGQAEEAIPASNLSLSLSLSLSLRTRRMCGLAIRPRSRRHQNCVRHVLRSKSGAVE